MKIIFTTDKLNRGGKERQLLIIAKGLLQRGLQVNIISKNEIDQDDYYGEIGFPLDRIFILTGENEKRLLKKYKNKLLELNPDVILSWSVLTTLWTIRLKSHLRKTPIINCTLRQGTHYDSLKQRFLSKVAVKLSQFNISNSKAGLNLFSLKENGKNKVIYNAFVESSNENSRSISLDQVFGKKMDKSDIVIANIGGLYKHKNQLNLIQAIQKLNDDRYHLMIIGEGNQRKQLESFINEHNLSKRVLLLGRQESVLPYLKVADIYVNASSGEGCSNAIVEAMHCGLPVISTPDGGTTEIAYPETTLFFEFNNVTELVKCIKEAPNKKDLDREKLTEWLNMFDPKRTLDRYEEFIKSVAS